MINKKINKVLIIDFWSEKNKGDAAIQVGLIDVVLSQFPEAEISIITATGSNQSEDIPEHFSHSIEKGVRIRGGIFPTLIPLSPKYRNGFFSFKPFRMLYIGSYFIYCILLLLLIKIRIPMSFLKVIMPSKRYESLRDINESDLVIWRGTNFRPGNTWYQKIIVNFQLVYHALLSAAFKKRMFCIGISLWPFNIWSRFLFKTAFKNCFAVAARERRSYDALKDLLHNWEKTKVLLIPDLSVYALKGLVGFHAKPVDMKLDKLSKIGITITDRHVNDEVARNQYIKTLVNLVDFTLENVGEKVIFVPQTTKAWEDSTYVINEVLRRVNKNNKNRIVNITRELSIEELLNVYKDLDALIATRLHSSIFALSTGTPVFVLRYDEGPQWNILNTLGADEFVFDYSIVENELIVDKFSSFTKNIKDYPIDKIITNFENCYTEIQEKFNYIKNL